MGSALHRHFQILKIGIFKVWQDDSARDSRRLQKLKKVQIVFQETSENRSNTAWALLTHYRKSTSPCVRVPYPEQIENRVH
jgi:hypothetical protein